MTGVRPVEGGVELRLHVQPRAARTELAGVHGDCLKVRVAAPPVEDAANNELVRFLSVLLEKPARDIELVSGARGRRKVIRLHGAALGEVVKRLA